MYCTGILFVKLSGENNHFFKENCVEKNISYEDFETCVTQNKMKTPLIKSVGIKSFKKQLYLTSYGVSDMIFPYNHSIGVKRDLKNPTFHLNPAYTFVLFLFDIDYFLYVTNPLIVHRSMMKVSSTTTPSILMLGIEVSRK